MLFVRNCSECCKMSFKIVWFEVVPCGGRKTSSSLIFTLSGPFGTTEFRHPKTELSRLMTKPTKWHVRPAKTQISLGIRPVWVPLNWKVLVTAVGDKFILRWQLSRLMTKPTLWLCAQRRLRSAWAFAQSDQSLRCPHEKIARVLSNPLSTSEDSDQSGQMPSLIWVFAGRTCHIVGFVVTRLMWLKPVLVAWGMLHFLVSLNNRLSQTDSAAQLYLYFRRIRPSLKNNLFAVTRLRSFSVGR